MLIAVISTLISSVALVGVALSLLMQARQLRTNQVQISRATQLEIIKITLDNPGMALETLGALGVTDSETNVKEVFLNLNFRYFGMSYEIKAISESALRFQTRMLFNIESTRHWWARVREAYEVDATSRREKEFFAIVDGEFQRASARPTA